MTDAVKLSDLKIFNLQRRVSLKVGACRGNFLRGEAGGLTERSRGIASQPIAHDLNVWRMPPLDQLPAARLSAISRIWMIVLRGYLIIAAGLVLFRIFQLATVGA
jgi:hypothetical protein